MARIEISSYDFCGGSLTVDLDPSSVIEDLSTADVLSALKDNGCDVSDIISELDTDEIIEALDSDGITNWVVDHCGDVGESLVGSWLNCTSADAEDLRRYALNCMALDITRMAKDFDDLGLGAVEKAWKEVLMHALAAQLGYVAVLGSKGIAETMQPVSEIFGEEEASVRAKHRVETLAKLDALETEIRLIKESIHADPHTS